MYVEALPDIPDPEPKNPSLADEAQSAASIVANFTGPVKAAILDIAAEILAAKGSDYASIAAALADRPTLAQVEPVPDPDGQPNGYVLTVQDGAFVLAAPAGAPGSTLPGVPTGLIATPGNGQVSLSVTAPADDGTGTLSDYEWQWRTPSGSGSYTSFSHSASTTPSIVITGLTNGSMYGFRVRAISEVGPGAYTAEATATPSAGGSVEDWTDSFTAGTLHADWQLNPPTGYDNLIVVSGGRMYNGSASIAEAVRPTGTDGTFSIELLGNGTGSGDMGGGIHLAYLNNNNRIQFYGNVVKVIAGVVTEVVSSAAFPSTVAGDIVSFTVTGGDTFQMYINGDAKGSPFTVSQADETWAKAGPILDAGRYADNASWTASA